MSATLLINNLEELVEETQSANEFGYVTGAVTDNAPTKAELETILGTADSYAAGYKALVNDSGGTALVYLVVSNGTDWFYEALTKAI